MLSRECEPTLIGLRLVCSMSLAFMMIACVCPLVSGQVNGTISQVVIVTTINYVSGLPFPASITVTYTCLNPGGSWYPYSVHGWAGVGGASFTISCTLPATFNPWIHVYGRNSNWWGVTDYKGIPSQGGAPVSLVVALYISVYPQIG